jgi:hypothetical protein
LLLAWERGVAACTRGRDRLLCKWGSSREVGHLVTDPVRYIIAEATGGGFDEIDVGRVRGGDNRLDKGSPEVTAAGGSTELTADGAGNRREC